MCHIEELLSRLIYAHVLAHGILHEDKEIVAEPRVLLLEERGLGDAAGIDAGEGGALALVELRVEEVGRRQ